MSYEIVGDPAFRPSQIKVDSLGINISDTSLNNLNLSSTQSLIVGESVQANGPNIYALVVDNEGIAINAPIPDRASGEKQYALYVDGDAFITGSLVACNISGHSNIGGAAGSNSQWQSAFGNDTQIYLAGNATVGGNATVAAGNQNAFLIYESADRTILHAQLAVDNTQGSRLSAGIIGTASNSPAVIHTNNAPIEFHVRRPASYFDSLYVQPTVTAGGISNYAAEVPYYVNVTSNTAPHMVIDASGNVGIHTHVAPTYTYLHRTELPGNVISNVTQTDTMALSAHGPVFASNLLIYDVDSKSAKDINELFVRTAGVFLPAKQVLPGDFAPGPYTFVSNLSVQTPIEDDYALAVGASVHVHSNLDVDGHSTLYAATLSNLRATENAIFDKDVDVLQDLYVHETLRLYNGLAVAQGLAGSNITWQNVQFTLAEPGYSNINLFGAGITTPGQFGAGISIYDEVRNQLVVYKRETRIWELELGDRNDPFFDRVAFLGHPLTSNATDGSFVIATPADSDPRFTRGGKYSSTVSHIYLYPGIDTSTANSNVPLIRRDNPPVLGAFTNKRVGINTFMPQADLHVEGNVAYTGTFNLWDNTNNTLSAIAPWFRKSFANLTPGAGGPTFNGIIYNDAAAAHVGINTLPDARYGLVVAGGIQSLDGFVSPDGQTIKNWVVPTAATDANVVLNPTPYYAQGPVGIGITAPQYPLEIMNRNGTGGGETFLKLYTTPATSNVGIQFRGAGENWRFMANTNRHQVELYADVLPTGTGTGIGGYSAATSNARALRARFDPLTQKYQVHLGMDGNTNYTAVLSNLDANAAVTVGGNLNVVGDVRITGNYYRNTILASAAVAAAASNFPIPNYTDDVYIGGQYVHLYMTPPSTSLGAITPFVSVGYPDAATLNNEVVNASTNAVMRVYQSFPTTHPSVLRLATVNPRCYIELVAAGKTLYMGMNEAGDFSVVKSSALGAQQTFFNVSAANGWPATGFNTPQPRAVVHVSGDTNADLFRVTRHMAASTPEAYASLQLETLAGGTDNRMWQIQGPNTAFENKLAFVYKSATGADSAAATAGTEAFTFAANGCIGIGNTQPVYAIDVNSTGSRGSIRLYNSDNQATPQLIFQSGSNIYGADSAQTDYRWYSFDNRLTLESANPTNNARKLLDFGPTGNVGIRTEAHPSYNLNVIGSLNVTERILLDGKPLFSTDSGSAVDAFDVVATNILLRPIIVTDVGDPQYGGLVINGTAATSNLFHIHSGLDANMMVYDSSNVDVMVHYRVNTGGTTREMVRQTMSSNTFGWQHLTGAPSDLYIPAALGGWCNVFGWAPQAGVAGAYDFTMHGSLALAADATRVDLSNGVAMEQNGGNLFFNSQLNKGYGFNVSTLRGALHVGNNAKIGEGPAGGLIVENASAATTPQAIFTKVDGAGAFEGGKSVVITADGATAFGALAPAAGVRVDVNGVLQVTPGSAAAPTVTFAGSSGAGLFAPVAGQVAIGTGGAERMRVTGGGVAVGVTSATAGLHVGAASNVQPVVRVAYSGESNAAPVFVTETAAGAGLVVNGASWVGVGTLVPDAPLNVVGGFHFASPGTFDSNVEMLQNLNVTGNVIAAGNNLGLSDRRLKTDLVRISDALDKVEALTGYTYTRIDTGARATGLVAQDVAAVLPEAVAETDAGMLAVAYGNLAGLLVEAIKELRADVAGIKMRLGM